MKFLLDGLTELGYNQLLAVNGGCSGSCSGVTCVGAAGLSGKSTIFSPQGTPGVSSTGYNKTDDTTLWIAISGNCGSSTSITSATITNSINKNMDNQANKYVKGENDCDIWVESVLKSAGLDISSIWGNAKNTTVAGHEEKLEKLTTDYAQQGWSVVLMTDSDKYSTNHCGLAKVSGDGSVLFYQNTKSNGGPLVEKYSSVTAFEKAYAYKDFDYWNISGC